MTENIENKNINPEAIRDTNVLGQESAHETINNKELNDLMLRAQDVENEAKANEGTLSNETKEKVGFLSKIMTKLLGGNNEQKNAKTLDEIMSHPSAKLAYEQAVEKGRGELYVEAFRKYGLPLYWRENEGRYGGQPWSSN